MRYHSLLLAAGMAVALVTGVCAGQIYTSGDGDGIYWYAESGGALSQEFIGSLSDAILQPTYALYPGDVVQQGRAILVFPISELSGTTLALGSVTLNFYGGVYPGDGTWEAYHVGVDYGPSVNLDYGRLGLAESLVISGGYLVTEWVQVDVTAFVQADIDAGLQHSAFAIAPYDWEMFPPQEASAEIYASESGQGPYLDIVPEPASLIAVLCGVGGLLVRRRRS